MGIVSIVIVLACSIGLCYIELPKMIEMKMKKERWTFLILLFLGNVLTILKSLDLNISTPSDWVAWVFYPLQNILKSFFKI